MFDKAFAWLKVVASEVSGETAAVLWNVVGVGPDDADDEQAEQGHGQEVFGGLGHFGRPLPPDGDEFLEALGVRTSDGVVPIASRDLRLNRSVNPSGGGAIPKEGQILQAFYGGGFISGERVAGGGSLMVWYCPYDFDGDGIPQKAHCITLDPTPGNESLSIVHGDGYGLQCSSAEGWTLCTPDGESWARLKDGEFLVNCAKIMLQGNVAVGASVATAAPLAASSTSTSFFVAP